MIQIYHNPSCRKSRECLTILQEKNIEYEVNLYLKDPLKKKDLIQILQLLNIPAAELIRKEEKIFKTQYKQQSMNEMDYIQAMLDHPRLIQRPIIIHKDKAIIGRPPSKLIDFLDC